MHRGKDTTHENLETMRVFGRNNVGRAASVKGSNIVALHFGNHKKKRNVVGSKV